MNDITQETKGQACLLCTLSPCNSENQNNSQDLAISTKPGFKLFAPCLLNEATQGLQFLKVS